jgi:hypothetical protein
MLRLLAFIMICAAAPVPTAAAPDDPPPDKSQRSPRVRAADSRTAALLAQGLERSATIRAFVNELEQRDVIVYLEIQPALKKRLAGTLTWLSASQSHRYVRISINPELSTDLAISTMGHELQHALEVANAPDVVSEPTLERYYRTYGQENRAHINGWDTEAARVAGEDVRRELADRTTRVADSIQQFDPQDWFVVYRRTRGMLPP